MENIKKVFKENEWSLILYVLQNEKKDKKNKDISWVDLNTKFEIFVGETHKDKTIKQISDSTRGIWNKFLRHVTKNDLTLVTVKQTLDGNGNLLFETKKKDVVKQDYDLESLTISKVTTNPYGGEWISYSKDKTVKEDNTILVAVDELFNKYLSKLDINNLVPDAIDPKKDIYQNESSKISKKIAVVNLYDAHLDKLSLKSTCGVESTLEQNLEVFSNTIKDIKKALVNLGKLEYIIFPVGNDLFHTNGMNNTTKKGTPIEYLCSPEEAYYQICDIITDAIKTLAGIAPVKVIMVKGNHDEDKITVLGFWLERYFKVLNNSNKNFNNVEVDYLRSQRKYIHFGNNIIGFAHGDKEKSKIAQLPLIMATEAKEMWGKTTYRKMYLGDLHHGFEYQFLKAKDQPGVEVEYLRSVGTTDTWHQDFGWIGIPKTAYLQLFDENNGEFIRIKLNIK